MYSLTEDYDGTVALVTGGARGIGLGIVETLAGLGATVAINDVDESSLEDTCTRLERDGASVSGIHADVSDPAAVEAMFETARDRHGGLDLVVNNAAVVTPSDYADLTPTEWREVMAVNLDGVHYCCRTAAPMLAADGGGAIVNMSSIAGQRISLLGGAHYTTSKWGVIGLTRHVAHEFGPDGVRVNAVCPGPAVTPLTEAMTDEAERRAVAEERIPLGRWGEPEDVAMAVAFLGSSMAGYVTGTTLTVDGGFTIE